jgi:hypothetical protein
MTWIEDDEPAATLTEAATSAPAAAAMATTQDRMGRNDIRHTLSYTPVDCTSPVRALSQILIRTLKQLFKLS